MRKWRWQTPMLLVLAILLVAGGIPAMAAGPGGPITGSIYTTTAYCEDVNLNVYESKSAVHLSGGPRSSGGHGLSPAGEWVWQITDPNGGTLLSTEDIEYRTFTVGENGMIVGYADPSRYTVCNPVSGKIAISLVPYDDTPNGGGVYKLWATPKDLYLTHGFRSAYSVTDNFKIESTEPCNPGDPGCGDPVTSAISVLKFFDTNGNAVQDAGEAFINGWEMTLTYADGTVIETLSTALAGSADFSGLMPDFDYAVYETLTSDGGMPGTGRPGFAWEATTPTYVPFTAGLVNAPIFFGNRCVAPATYGRTLGFWSNKNGQALIENNGGLAYLSNLGANWYMTKPGAYDLSKYGPAKTDKGLRQYLLDANASKNTSMAWMLSAQLMASALSVHNSSLSPNDLIVWAPTTPGTPQPMTVQELLNGAITALNTGADRAQQEMWKNLLDYFNNNINITTIVGSGCEPVYPAN